jgi:hypothetical protein
MRRYDPQRDSALRELLLAGAPALEQAKKAIMREHSSLGLEEFIRRSGYAEAVPALRILSRSDLPHIAGNAMCALADSGDPEARAYLLTVLTDEKLNEVRRSFAAEALGGNADDEIMSVLRQIAEELALTTDFDADDSMLLVETIGALARNGDMSMAGLLLTLTDSSHEPAQELAVTKLDVAVADGMIDVLARAARSDFRELQLAAVHALFLLGDNQCCTELLAVAKSDEGDAGYNAVILLGKILGVRFSGWEPYSELADVWRSHRSTIAEMVCHRSGRPTSYPALAAELVGAAEESMRRELSAEIQERTGIDVRGIILMKQEHTLLNDVERMHTTDGTLYRWGHRQEFPRSTRQ